MFLGTAIFFFFWGGGGGGGVLAIVEACYRAMQRVTVIKGLNCTKITTVFLQVLRSTDIVRLNCRAQ